MEKFVHQKYQETYFKKQLKNGLTVILWHKPNHNKNLFMMATPYGAAHHVQEINEKETISHPHGIAHFLEHKMFSYKKEDVMEQFSKMGADVNAFTSYYETVYYTSTTQDPIQPLHLLLNFVQELDIDEKSVEKEKGIIIQELQMYKQQSEQRLVMELYQALYQNHPIKIDIGGDEESVLSTTKEQLYRCYEYNYHPSKMLFVGVINCDPQQILQEIEKNQMTKKFHNPIKIQNVKIEEPLQVVNEHVVFEMEVHQPKVCVAYKQTPIKNPIGRLKHEWCIRFLLEEYFSTLSIQYQEWMDQQIITSYNGCDVDYGDEYGYIMFFTETLKIKEFIQICNAVMQKIVNGTITNQVFQQLKRRFYAQQLRAFNNFEDIAISVVRSHFEHRNIFASIELIEALTISDIQSAAALISSKNHTIVELNPKK